VVHLKKIYAKDKGKLNPPYELVSDDVITWGSGTYAFTQLVNHLNQVNFSSQIQLLSCKKLNVCIFQSKGKSQSVRES
jgi:hypothetical protein